jgi:hypothetical protein
MMSVTSLARVTGLPVREAIRTNLYWEKERKPEAEGDGRIWVGA